MSSQLLSPPNARASRLSTSSGFSLKSLFGWGGADDRASLFVHPDRSSSAQTYGALNDTEHDNGEDGSPSSEPSSEGTGCFRAINNSIQQRVVGLSTSICQRTTAFKLNIMGQTILSHIASAVAVSSAFSKERGQDYTFSAGIIWAGALLPLIYSMVDRYRAEGFSFLFSSNRDDDATLENRNLRQQLQEAIATHLMAGAVVVNQLGRVHENLWVELLIPGLLLFPIECSLVVSASSAAFLPWKGWEQGIRWFNIGSDFVYSFLVGFFPLGLGLITSAIDGWDKSWDGEIIAGIVFIYITMRYLSYAGIALGRTAQARREQLGRVEPADHPESDPASA